MIRKYKTFRSLINCEMQRLGLVLGICWTLLVFFSGCTSDKTSVDQPTEDTLHGVYGKGSIAFDIDSTLHFNVTGAYKPSDQFQNDTLSQGAGGFLKDTLVATLFNHQIQALLAGYSQKQDTLNLTRYLLVIGLCDSGTSLHTGQYQFAKNNQNLNGRSMYAYFIPADSTHYSDIYVPKTGSLSLTLFDQSNRHVRGTLSGTLYLPPDTTITISLTNGQFDLYLVKTFFNY
jgi:hypothetical protein